MLDAAAHLDLYRKISALAARMSEAARAQEWERLAEMQQAMDALHSRLPPDNAGLSAAAQEQKTALIRQILADEAVVLRHAGPWLEDVRGFLGGPAKKKQVENAYRAGAGPLS